MNVDVVIVTFNRLEKLKKALASYEKQTKSFRNMIVVNNHSTDGTLEYLEEWKQKEAPFSKYVITTEDNLGGSGGFYTGQRFAMTLNPDWVYLADDDAYAEHDMMEQFYKFCETHDVSKLSAICGAVCDIDGHIDVNHRSNYEIIRHRIYHRHSSTIEDYKKDDFPIDFLSYVGSFVKMNSIVKVGPVNPSFFIYQDDSEHSLRLRKTGQIVCVPSIKIVHDDKTINKQKWDDDIISWRDYYSVRNETFMLIKYFPLVAIHRLRKRIFKCCHRKNKDGEYEKLVRTAIKDAWLRRMGKHPIYKPGWQTNKI